jgi:hypothetical protein
MPVVDPAPIEADADAEADEFTASQRRRKQITGVIAIVAVAIVAAVILISRANKLPPLDPKTVANVREALDTVPAEYHRELAAHALVELEGERLPSGLLRAFESAASAPPGMGGLLLLASIAEDEDARQLWLLACEDGVNALADLGMQGGGAAELYRRCSLDRFGLIGESELGGVAIGELVAAHAVWAHLVEHRSETDLERRVLRAIMGRR